MEREHAFNARYKGTKGFTQHDVHAANATGFGAAADDYSERGIDLNEQLIRNKPATFFFLMNGDAMTGAGIFNGDILIVDKSIKAKSGKIIVAIVEGDMIVRRLHQTMNTISLIPENPQLSIIKIEEFSGLQVWGVVTYVIHAV
jgi:DNA polymerase V